MLGDSLIVFGTRPEEIKLYPLWKQTGWTALRIDQSPDLQQDLITHDFPLPECALEKFIKCREWKRVVVQGDTRTAFRAALYAYEAGWPVVHVEAGLRTHNLADPRPEEGYRRMIDAVSSYKFCSTPEAAKECGGEYVGQTSIDTLFEFLPPITDEGYTIVTLHRRDSDVSRWVEVIKRLKNPLIFAHPNETGQALKQHFPCLDPVPYREFLTYLAGCSGVATDSGGLQEEALAIGKPVTLLRDCSERGHGETYTTGATQKIIAAIERTTSCERHTK